MTTEINGVAIEHGDMEIRVKGGVVEIGQDPGVRARMLAGMQNANMSQMQSGLAAGNPLGNIRSANWHTPFSPFYK